MEDVNEPNVQADEAVGEETSTQVPQPEKQTTETTDNSAEKGNETETPAERSVPISVLQKERKQRQELQRKLAEVEGSRKLDKYDPNDLEGVMSHPYVQDLLIKQAKQELTDHARTLLDQYPKFPASIRKQILANVRGFVNENTTEIEQGKLDLQEYIESIAQEAEEADAQVTETPTAKTFPIAETNTSKTSVEGVTPTEVSRILEKPVDEWTDEDEKTIEEYTKTKK